MGAKDFLALDDFGAAELEALARRAIGLAADWSARTMPQSLKGRRIGVISALPGWRNPTALALGAVEMGATCVNVPVLLEGGEALEDLAGYLDNWFDCVAVRTPSLETLRAISGGMQASVINLRTHANHPIEVLADLAYVLAQRGSWAGLTVAVVAPRGNILQSWIEAAAVLPISVVQISHPSYFADGPCEGFLRSEDMGALNEADLIVTDCWPKGADVAEFAKLRVTADVLDACKKDAIFIPCPPVTRGQEVSAEAMAHPKCAARAAKNYLLHAQNAVLEDLLAG